MENVYKCGHEKAIELESFAIYNYGLHSTKQFIGFRRADRVHFTTWAHKAERDEHTVHGKLRRTGQVARNTLHGKTSYGCVTGYRVRV